MKLLLATDGSDYAQWACETIGHLATTAQATIYLLHVTTPIPEPMVPFPDVFIEQDLLMRDQIEKEHETRASERLEACRDMLPADWRVIPEHRVGAPAREILAAVEEHGIDLVMLGARGMDQYPFGDLGSVSQKVARYAPCPVMVCRRPGVPMRHVLVALDNGPDTPAVLDYVGNASWLKDATITVTHVVEDRYLQESRIAASQFAGSESYITRLQSGLLQAGRVFVDQQAATLKAKGLKTDTLVLEGDPRTVLEARAATGKFDLLVLGSRGRHGLSRFLMGGTSLALLRHTDTSVLLVRPL